LTGIPRERSTAFTTKIVPFTQNARLQSEPSAQKSENGSHFYPYSQEIQPDAQLDPADVDNPQFMRNSEQVQDNKDLLGDEVKWRQPKQSEQPGAHSPRASMKLLQDQVLLWKSKQLQNGLLSSARWDHLQEAARLQNEDSRRDAQARIDSRKTRILSAIMRTSNLSEESKYNVINTMRGSGFGERIQSTQPLHTQQQSQSGCTFRSPRVHHSAVKRPVPLKGQPVPFPFRRRVVDDDIIMSESSEDINLNKAE